jgi:hypothetical protein
MMRNDTLIKREGMLAISERLNLVEAERFITLILREPFDYTEWQRNLYEDMSVEELSAKAAANWHKKRP